MFKDTEPQNIFITSTYIASLVVLASRILYSLQHSTSQTFRVWKPFINQTDTRDTFVRALGFIQDGIIALAKPPHEGVHHFVFPHPLWELRKSDPASREDG